MLPEIFNTYENELTEKISNSDSPFLGLFADYFKDFTRNKIISLIQQSYNPFRRYIDNLSFFPALCATILVIQLLEDFGEHGHFEVYPVLERIFGKKLIQSQKLILWKAFRKSCLNLGLSVSPYTSGTHFMVEEYLRQTGLPFRYVSKVTEKALRYATQVGVPDIDDPESLKLWQEGLIERLTYPVPIIAKRAIERDDGCYYVQRFVNIYSSPPENIDSLTRLETLMLKTIIEGPQIRSVKKAAIAQIVFRDLEYGVLLPGGEKLEWQITVGGEVKSYTLYADERFVPFDNLLPCSIQITNDTGAKWSYTLWEDNRNNRLLIFSLPAGKYIKRASLADDEIFVDPGKYLLVSRFISDDLEDIEVFSDDPSLYLKEIQLNPGQSISLKKGPAELVLKANEIPVLNLIGEPFRGLRGNELYPSDGLKLEAIIPKELIDTGVDFYLQLKSNCLGDVIMFWIPGKVGTTSHFDLDEAFSQWEPGVSRILIELYREDSRRPITRKSVVIWNGLVYIQDRILFYCNSMPTNLYPDECENLKTDDSQKIITFRDETNRFFKMAFDDNNRNLYFTWAVPGIFLGLLTYTQQVEMEKRIRLGESISISATTRKVLNIYAVQPGILQLGQFILHVDFSRVGSKKIPLASLIEYLGPGDNILEFIDKRTETRIPLVQLVSPFEVSVYRTESIRGLKKIYFEVANEIEAIRISAENLIDGSEYYVEFTLYNSKQELYDELAPGVIVWYNMVEKKSCDISFPDTNWPDGFWLIRFQINANGRWGTLTNSKNEIYADGLFASPKENAKTWDEVYSMFEENHEPLEITKIYSRLHKVLLTPYAQESWEQLSWLEKLWDKISYRIIPKQCSNESLCELLQVSTEQRNDALLEFQIPYYNIGSTLPQIYCLDKTCYNSIGYVGNSLLGCISFLSKLSDLYQSICENKFDFAVLFGFKNAAQVANQEELPQGFDMSSYKIAMKQRDIQDRWRLLHDDQWLPGIGDMLGPMHYRYALTRFQDTFRNNLSEQSNRMGKALFLARQMSQSSIADFHDKGSYEALKAEIDLGVFDYDEPQPEWISDEIATEREHQLNIIRVLSLFSQICRIEARHPGVVQRFCSIVQDKCNYPNSKKLTKTLGYLLSIGEDLFAFYLLLWELVFSADCDPPRRVYV